MISLWLTVLMYIDIDFAIICFGLLHTIKINLTLFCISIPLLTKTIIIFTDRKNKFKTRFNSLLKCYKNCY